MKSKTVIGVVIVSYKSSEKVKRLIASFNSFDDRLRVIVVDNSECADEVAAICSIGLQIKVIGTDFNGGFSYGTNIGVKAALKLNVSGVLMLNPDTMLDVNFFSVLFDAIQKNNRVAYSPLGRRMDDGAVWANGGAFHWFKGRADVLKSSNTNSVRTPFGTCACLYVPEELIRKIGLLDPNYFLGGEEWDYSLKINNYSMIYTLPECVYKHEVSGTHAKYGPLFFYIGMRTKLIYTMSNYRLKWLWLFVFILLSPLIVVKNKRLHCFTFVFGFSSIVRAIVNGAARKGISKSELDYVRKKI